MMAKSKKQVQHMIQNVVHKVRHDIKQSEQRYNDPKKKLEDQIYHAYYEAKHKMEKE